MEILIGVCGGVAAYKTAELTSRLVQAQHDVTVAMSPSAEKFIGKTTFEALTGRPVYREIFEPQEHFIGEHIGLSRRADLFVIAPATANMIGKLTHGIADNLVATLGMTVTCPVLIAPAMNNEMWTKPAVERNMKQLKEDGLHIIGPDDGWLSCGAVGPGRMATPEAIEQAINQLLKPRTKGEFDCGSEVSDAT